MSEMVFKAVLRPFQAFLRLEAASGIVLLLSAVAALVWANLHGQSYRAIFEVVGTFSPRTLINDGLMTIFFLVVGMEIKHELVLGELNTVAKAALPAIAAIGGMIVPSGIFLAFTWGRPGQAGWGIPMATDIAFCIGVLTLLKDRVPRALVVFIMALAIFDDIGGILVIALFYGRGVNVSWLAGAASLTLVLVVMGRRRVASSLAYAAVGAVLWYALHRGGIHATISGVIVGLCMPASSSGLVRFLHPLAAWGIMPLFALANTGLRLGTVGVSALASPVALGAGLGLLVGKPVGVFGFTLLAARLGFAPMPGNASMGKLAGVSVIAGIGFTVSLFIAALAFGDAPSALDAAKLGILLGSLLAGVTGYLLLRLSPLR